jgi:hypothetical protein
MSERPIWDKSLCIGHERIDADMNTILRSSRDTTTLREKLIISVKPRMIDHISRMT